MSGDNGDNNAGAGIRVGSVPGLDRGLPQSRYMRLKVEIEQEEKALAKKRRDLELIKQEERDHKLYDVRQLITLYGFTPRECFPHEKNLKGAGVSTAHTEPRADGRTDKGDSPVRFVWQGQTWSGIGKRPNWYKAAIDAGTTKAEMAAEAARWNAEHGGPSP